MTERGQLHACAYFFSFGFRLPRGVQGCSFAMLAHWQDHAKRAETEKVAKAEFSKKQSQWRGEVVKRIAARAQAAQPKPKPAARRRAAAHGVGVANPGRKALG